MQDLIYLVRRFDGDYAVLVPEDDPLAPENPVALALLPFDIEEGSRLLCRDFSYTLV